MELLAALRLSTSGRPEDLAAAGSALTGLMASDSFPGSCLSLLEADAQARGGAQGREEAGPAVARMCLIQMRRWCATNSHALTEERRVEYVRRALAVAPTYRSFLLIRACMDVVSVVLERIPAASAVAAMAPLFPSLSPQPYEVLAQQGYYTATSFAGDVFPPGHAPSGSTAGANLRSDELPAQMAGHIVYLFALELLVWRYRNTMLGKPPLSAFLQESHFSALCAEIQAYIAVQQGQLGEVRVHPGSPAVAGLLAVLRTLCFSATPRFVQSASANVEPLFLLLSSLYNLICSSQTQLVQSLANSSGESSSGAERPGADSSLAAMTVSLNAQLIYHLNVFFCCIYMFEGKLRRGQAKVERDYLPFYTAFYAQGLNFLPVQLALRWLEQYPSVRSISPRLSEGSPGQDIVGQSSCRSLFAYGSAVTVGGSFASAFRLLTYALRFQRVDGMGPSEAARGAVPEAEASAAQDAAEVSAGKAATRAKERLLAYLGSIAQQILTLLGSILMEQCRDAVLAPGALAPTRPLFSLSQADIMQAIADTLDSSDMRVAAAGFQESIRGIMSGAAAPGEEGEQDPMELGVLVSPLADEVLGLYVPLFELLGPDAVRGFIQGYEVSPQLLYACSTPDDIAVSFSHLCVFAYAVLSLFISRSAENRAYASAAGTAVVSQLLPVATLSLPPVLSARVAWVAYIFTSQGLTSATHDGFPRLVEVATYSLGRSRTVAEAVSYISLCRNMFGQLSIELEGGLSMSQFFDGDLALPGSASQSDPGQSVAGRLLGQMDAQGCLGELMRVCTVSPKEASFYCDLFDTLATAIQSFGRFAPQHSMSCFRFILSPLVQDWRGIVRAASEAAGPAATGSQIVSAAVRAVESARMDLEGLLQNTSNTINIGATLYTLDGVSVEEETVSALCSAVRDILCIIGAETMEATLSLMTSICAAITSVFNNERTPSLPCATELASSLFTDMCAVCDRLKTCDALPDLLGPLLVLGNFIGLHGSGDLSPVTRERQTAMGLPAELALSPLGPAALSIVQSVRLLQTILESQADIVLVSRTLCGIILSGVSMRLFIQQAGEETSGQRPLEAFALSPTAVAQMTQVLGMALAELCAPTGNLLAGYANLEQHVFSMEILALSALSTCVALTQRADLLVVPPDATPGRRRVSTTFCVALSLLVSATWQESTDTDTWIVMATLSLRLAYLMSLYGISPESLVLAQAQAVGQAEQVAVSGQPLSQAQLLEKALSGLRDTCNLIATRHASPEQFQAAMPQRRDAELLLQRYQLLSEVQPRISQDQEPDEERLSVSIFEQFMGYDDVVYVDAFYDARLPEVLGGAKLARLCSLLRAQWGLQRQPAAPGG